MVSFPPCKINLGLHVVEKRSDGYHTIETCFYPTPWTDILEIIPSKEFIFSSSGLAIAGTPQDNLCVKAYNLLKEEHRITAVHIHLHKVIPFGAGLGGGSSDAAHTLTLLNSIFELNLSPQTLHQYASILGSDCPFFLYNKPMMGLGRGDELSAIDVSLKGKFVVVVKPPYNISTREAYAHIVPGKASVSLSEILGEEIHMWKNKLINDFELSVTKQYPDIGEIKNTLYAMGAVYASMSGSGSAVFGIFNDTVDLEAKFKGSTFWSGFFNV